MPRCSASADPPGVSRAFYGGFTLRLEACDWNCPQHVTPRFTAAEIERGVAPLHARIAALEAENAALRGAHSIETIKEPS